MVARDVLDALLTERFGPPPLRPPQSPSVDGDDDTTVLAGRQRVLCEALDGPSLFVVQRRSA